MAAHFWQRKLCVLKILILPLNFPQMGIFFQHKFCIFGRKFFHNQIFRRTLVRLTRGGYAIEVIWWCRFASLLPQRIICITLSVVLRGIHCEPKHEVYQTWTDWNDSFILAFWDELRLSKVELNIPTCLVFECVTAFSPNFVHVRR